MGARAAILRDPIASSSGGKAAAGPGSAAFPLMLIALLSVYVLAQLTPSSYALALQVFGATPRWVSLGEPREIRTDEWAVWTPYMQATVRNHFQRYNGTSPYLEDLRNMNALPLLDWGLTFKPYFWPFFMFPPAYAYSFFFAFQVFCFLYGYRQLFRRLQVADELAVGGSMLLFFCGYTQYWWTTLGPTLSFFPWVVLAAMQRHRWWKYPLVGYTAVAWVFGMAYPPAVISLCFVAAILFCTFRNRTAGGIWEPLLMAGALACAGALIWLYYHDLLRVTMQTVYPGHRRSSSGTESLRLLLGMLSPAFNQNGYQPLGSLNICESGVVGSFLPLSVIAFIDYHAIRKLILGQMRSFPRWPAAILGGSMLLMLAWIFLPVPALLGKIFLWQFVPARRMFFAVGVLMTILCLWLLSACGVVLTLPRMCGFFGVVFAAIFSSKHLWSLAWKSTPRAEFLIFPVLLVASFLAWRRELTARQAVIYSCVVANLALFGFFNPLLSAREIFESRDTPTLRRLEKMQREDPRGWLVIGGFPGAVLNGQGFRSVQHVLISPHLQFFRERFPEMPEAEFNAIFNRYAHIRLEDVSAPYNPRFDMIALPESRFRASPALNGAGR